MTLFVVLFFFSELPSNMFGSKYCIMLHKEIFNLFATGDCCIIDEGTFLWAQKTLYEKCPS